MYPNKRHCLIGFSIFLFSFFQFGKSQNIPSIPCPDIFEYRQYGDNYIGMVTLSGVPLQNVVLHVEFSQREPITTNYNGKLSFAEDIQEVQRKLENGKPISYRVDFPNPHILPKLVSITLNGQTICQGQKYNAPSTTFMLQRSFFPASTSKITHIIEPKFEQNPNIFTYKIPQTTQTIRTQLQGQPSLNPNTFSSDNPFFKDIKEFLKDNDLPTSIFDETLPNSYWNRNTSIPYQPQFIPSVETRLKPATLAPPPPPPPSATTTQRNFVQPVRQPVQPAPPKPPTEMECGREGLTPFVAEGKEFERGKFPWLVAIYLRVEANLKFRCGGSLISSRTVITAGHCFPSMNYSPSLISVQLGRHNIFMSEEDSQHRDIDRLIVHPNYNVSVLPDADIALLLMSSPVIFNQYIRPICLWSQSSEISFIADSIGFVAGWGSDNKGNEVSPIATMAEAKIVNETECLRSAHIFRILTTARSICAGNRDNSGPCIGDSGGGLMLNVFGVWTLRGIVSAGETVSLPRAGQQTVRRKCILSEYVVYCDVAKHIPWIRRNMLR